jgi:hypothetical protein
MDPHKYQAPSSIEDAMRSVPVVSGLMPQTAHDLNADLSDRKVDVVFPNRDLLFAFVSSIAEHLHEVKLGWRRAIEMSVASLGHLDQGFGRMLLSSPSGPSAIQVGYPSSGTEFSHSVSLGVGGVPNGNSRFNQNSVQGSATIPERLLKLSNRRSGGVGFDQIVKRRSFQYDSHVFNLQTSQQWYHANGVVVHNCHADVALDKDGEPKVDAAGRKVYRVKKHDYQEFHAIIERHGLWDRDLKRLGETIIKQAQATLAFPVPVEAGASGEVTVQ